MKELFQKLGFLKNQGKETEINKDTKFNTKEIKENESSEELSGINFHGKENEDVLSGRVFPKDE